MNEKIEKKNQSVERVFQIIELMAENKGPMRLQDISSRLVLPASTVLRFVKTLLTYGYVNQDAETLKYSLSMKFCQIGEMVSSQLSIRDVVKPYLAELSEKSGESTCLAIEQDMMVVYIDAIDGPDSMLKTMQRIGRRAPLHSTGVGKLLLLNFDEKKLDLLVSQVGLAPLTPHTITTREELMAELDRIKALGYSLDNEECEIGARCIAAPIKDYSGKITAAVSVSGPATRMTLEKIDQIRDTIKEIAVKISRQLGYNGE